MLKKLIGIAVIVLVAQAAHADFTAPINTGEISQVDLLSGIYGETFSAVSGTYNFASASYTATRVEDFADGGTASTVGNNLELLGNPVAGDTDQLWNDGVTEVVAEARYAGYSQGFGFNTGSGDTQVFQVQGSKFDVTGSGVVDVRGQEGFRWVRTDGQQSPQYSTVADNADGIDHLVTYLISGPSGWHTGVTTWLLCWDDQLNGGDRDFNDLVVEVRAVPIPPAVVIGILGLGVAGIKLRKYV